MSGYEGHTPGPWRVIEAPGRRSVESDPGPDRDGIVVARMTGHSSSPSVCADAALIAAAPDLLTRVEALETAMKALTDEIEHEAAIALTPAQQQRLREATWHARHLLNNGNGRNLGSAVSNGPLGDSYK